MDFKTCAINVIADDKIVSVNGEAYKVRMAIPAELHALRWVPSATDPKLRGYIERKVGDSHHFGDFEANLGAFVKAWEVAKSEADLELARARGAADEARREVERQAARVQEEAQRKQREAQTKLAEEQAAHERAIAEAIEAKAAEHAKAMEDEVAKERAQRDQAATLNAALNTLVMSDHEVIKAMEAKLAAEGALAPELVSKRRAAREIAKAEKQKLA
jgi:hypothetical protein